MVGQPTVFTHGFMPFAWNNLLRGRPIICITNSTLPIN
jgi:hypothetical protein